MNKRLAVLIEVVVVGVLCVSSPLWAANRFFISNASLPLGSTGNTVTIQADIDQAIYGFSIHLTFDAAKIRVTGVQAGAAVAALSPEYNDGTVTNSPGRVVWGVVFDTSAPSITKNLAAGTNKEILKLTVDVVAASPTTVLLDLVNTAGNPSRLNVMTNANGDSVSPAPTLIDGTLTLASLVPDIQSIIPGEGTAGTPVLIVGLNFNQAGLAVTICGQTVSHTLLGDNQTLSVNAPGCAAGPAEVKVCTNFGCDSDPAGFTYEAGPQPPIIDAILDNTGMAGRQFFIIGHNFTVPGLGVTVCGVNATMQLLGDNQTIDVTAPACAQTGCAVVRVSTDAGNDSEPCGFTYESEGGTPFVRGNANNSGDVDLSDAVFTLNYLFTGGSTPVCLDAADANDTGTVELSDAVWALNFLFQGGPSIKPPYPDPGLDPTPDSLEDC